MVRQDKPNYIKAKVKTTSGGRLEAAASALRLTIQAGCTVVKFKTAISLLDHITSTLLTTDGELFEPLRNEYLKCLRTILDYAPHGEHLKPKQWQAYVDFVLDAVHLSIADPDFEEDPPSNRSTLSASRNGTHASGPFSPSANRRTSRNVDAAYLDDLLAALRSLTALTNAPLMSRATTISDAILDLLSRSSRSQDIALEAFNNVILVLLTENVGLLRRSLPAVTQTLRKLWFKKSTTPSVRNQILATFSLCRDLFLARPDSLGYIDFASKQQLFDTLLNEYRHRGARDLLSWDEILLVLSSAQPVEVHSKPNPDNNHAVSGWSLLSTLACLLSSLSHSRHNANTEDFDDNARKRRKVLPPVDVLLEQAQQSDIAGKLVALQILCVVFQGRDRLPIPIPDAMNDLIKLASSEDADVTNWAMFCFASFASCKSAVEARFSQTWVQLWDIAARALSQTSVSRSACLLLQTMITHGLDSPSPEASRLVNVLFSGSKSGPACFSDCALLLYLTVLQSSQLDTDSQFEIAGTSIIDWLDAYWILPSTVDRPHNSLVAFNGQTHVLCLLLAALRGAALDVHVVQSAVSLDSISRNEDMLEDMQGFVSYLNDTAGPPKHTSPQLLRTKRRELSSLVSGRLHHATVRMLDLKLKAFQSAWVLLSSGRSSQIATDVYMIITTLCVCSRILIATSEATQAEADSPTAKLVLELWHLVLGSLPERKDDRISKLKCLAQRLLHMRDSNIENTQISRALLTLYKPLLSNLQRTVKAHDNDDEEEGFDVAWSDSLANGAPQLSQPTSFNGCASTRRHKLVNGLASSISLSGCIVDLTLESERGKSISAQYSASNIIDTILSLNATGLLEAHGSILSFVEREPHLSRQHAARLLKRLAEYWLQDDALERNEAALCCCLRIMTVLTPVWTNELEDDLTEIAFDMYSWYVRLIFGKVQVSPRTSIVLASLLGSILQALPSYGTSEDLPSARTGLLRLVRGTSNFCKFNISSTLPRLFDGYVLTEHDRIFEDIVTNLPADPEDIEGIAVRLHVVTDLGSKWFTVLRQATYHIFETVENVPAVATLGSVCVRELCRALGLNSGRELFRLFASQILYTWLDSGSLARLPFNAFEYDSLFDLLSDNASEATAQIALRASPDHAMALSGTLGTPWDELLSRHFAQAEAYCLASQTSIPEKDQLSVNAEKSIRQSLGQEAYLASLRGQLPTAIGHLLLSLQDVEGVERSLEKADLNAPLATLKTINSLSSSKSILPAGPQPHFRSRYIMQELDWLCSRVSMTTKDIWSAAMLSYLYRFILQSASSSLGPLHACAMLRKLRLVLSLGGQSALEGYPIEMLLHTLRPYLTIFHCSEDAIGIYWYLLDKGRQYLRTRCSLVTALAISIFTDLATFVTSSQDSTTQETQYVATMSKAAQFRSWFNKYLEQMQSQFIDVQDSSQAFQDVLKTTRALNGPGSSMRSTKEGFLLLCLLQDQDSQCPLLEEAHFELALYSLTKTFAPATRLFDDILDTPEVCAQHSSTLRKILTSVQLSDNFRLWAIRSIGRGCTVNGLESDARKNAWSSSESTQHTTIVEANSYSSIVTLLSELLWRDDLVVSATAQQCLQNIATELCLSKSGALLGSAPIPYVLNDLSLDAFGTQATASLATPTMALPDLIDLQTSDNAVTWASQLLQHVCLMSETDPVLKPLLLFAKAVPSLCNELLPYAIHLVLVAEQVGARDCRTKLSQLFSHVFVRDDSAAEAIARSCIGVLLYLRRCRLATEVMMAQRDSWLEIDFYVVANAASRCGLWHAALLFAEIQQSHFGLQKSRSSRRSTMNDATPPPELMSAVYDKVDDPDFFYAGHEDADMETIIQKLDHEVEGYKAVSFHSAMLDSTLRSEADDTGRMAIRLATGRALRSANLIGISEAVVSATRGQPQPGLNLVNSSASTSLSTWNASTVSSVPNERDPHMKALVTLANSPDKQAVRRSIDIDLSRLSENTVATSLGPDGLQHNVASLVILSEARDLLLLEDMEDFQQFLQTTSTTDAWAKQVDFDQLSQLLEGREDIFRNIRRNPPIRRALKLTEPQALLLEAETVRQSLKLAQHHENSQFCLSRATYLVHLSRTASTLGISINGAAQYDLAKTLWSQNEAAASIRILRTLREQTDLSKQTIAVSAPDVLAELAHKVAEARLEPPGEVIAKYLQPAFEALGGSKVGVDAGRVFHTFAAFCDAQLQDIDGLDEYERVRLSREKRENEMFDLEKMMKKHKNAEREYNRSRTWFKIEDEEWNRIRANREVLIIKCLQNYLLSLRACDDYSSDTLRVLSIWLSLNENLRVNKTVHDNITGVPTSKFAGLMNQLMSRMLDTDDDFQHILLDLVFRICQDHPYHSLYQVFAASKSRGSSKDKVAASRNKAAVHLADLIKSKGSATSSIWIAVHNLSINLVKIAQEKISEQKVKSGGKISLRRLAEGDKFVATVEGSQRKLPPTTMRIPLRQDKKYDSVPVMVSVEPQVSIAGGVSAPKIATIRSADGARHKMLMKAGNDDLRQDSIMEQVFEQVSDLLTSHRATRRRKLGIRTYKVVPLYPNAGVIEFVQNTQPLHDFLMPAHARYYPKDYKQKRCRDDIHEVDKKSVSERIRVYRNVIANFHPVMRFFFMENFLDPDEWFYKRLNYSRSTAAISMLGHVLGLGDRHGHNILLDTITGEAVHIDLGVAFEAGRVLPIPELVPFRLTRDLVDGFGVSGVEGVFRRCCNFTLEALRQDQEAIMTILDVLRYDPLYSWSISPLRLQRMQEHAEAAAAAAAAAQQDTNATGTTDGANAGVAHAKTAMTESNEADRALAVVRKKLGKSLSVEATVNELIRQATDEKNLATLYCGWAAYA